MKTTNGFHIVEIPIPVPLKTVNGYLSKSEAGWHLIDTGFHTADGRAAWKQAFRELRIAPQDMAEIVVTHFHPDHSGLSGWLQEYTGAPVKISTGGKRLAYELWVGKKEAECFPEFAFQYGMGVESREKISAYLEAFPENVLPLPDFTTFEEGERFDWAGEEYVAIETPGHADGHMVFYSALSGTVVAGDLLLPKITPNVGSFPGFHPNPLKAFIQSLRKVKGLRLETVLPGHRELYRNGNRRADELIEHHQARLAEIVTEHVKGPSTVQGISELLFPFLSVRSSPLQLLFAFEETLAHLIYLEEEGFLRREVSRNGIVTFERVNKNEREIFVLPQT